MTTTFPRWPARVYLCAAAKRSRGTRKNSARHVVIYSSKKSVDIATISDCPSGFGGRRVKRLFGQAACPILGAERNLSRSQLLESVTWRPGIGSVLYLQGGGRTYCRLWRQGRFLSCASGLPIGLRGHCVENYLLDESAARRPLFRISPRNRPGAGALSTAPNFLDRGLCTCAGRA